MMRRQKMNADPWCCRLRTVALFDGVSHQAHFETKIGKLRIVKIPFTDFFSNLPRQEVDLSDFRQAKGALSH